MKKKDARSEVHPGHSFHDWQVWPGSYANPASSRYPRPHGVQPCIARDTPIAGIGSCFMREVKTRILAKGYHFIEEEAHDPAARHGSAAWERLYNLFCVRQVLDYALAGIDPKPRWWIAPRTGRVQDPYRRIVLYGSMAEAEAGFAAHRLAAARALTNARVLLLSLDYTEIWRDERTGSVVCLPSGPYCSEGGDMSRLRLRVSTLEENLSALEDILARLREHNPACRLILMLSPIQQWCTFREDAEIFAASFSSKAVLRTAAEIFTGRHPEVSYFPAYEAALLQRPALNLPVFAPGRENFHVCSQALDAVMDAFFAWYALDEGK